MWTPLTDPVMGAPQFGEIYLQELDQFNTVNTGEKSPCTSAQKFLFRSIYKIRLGGESYNYISTQIQITILVSALTSIGDGLKLSHSVTGFILFHL